MSEERPSYDTEPESLTEALEFALAAPMADAAPGRLPAVLVLYYTQRRDALIAELRALDRLLGRAQTVPVRRR